MKGLEFFLSSLTQVKFVVIFSSGGMICDPHECDFVCVYTCIVKYSCVYSKNGKYSCLMPSHCISKRICACDEHQFKLKCYQIHIHVYIFFFTFKAYFLWFTMIEFGRYRGFLIPSSSFQRFFLPTIFPILLH